MDLAQMMASFDILNIPAAAAAGRGGGIIGRVGMVCAVLAIPVFVMACVYEYSRLIHPNPKDPPDFVGTGLAMFWFASSYLIYSMVMKIPYIFDFVSIMLMPMDEWSNLVVTINNSQQAHGMTGFLNLSFTNILLATSLTLASIAEITLNAGRFILLYIAYVAGPFLILFGIHRPLRHLTKNWLLLFFQISFWPVTLKLVQGAILAFQFKSFIEGGNVLVMIVISDLMTIFILFGVPILTSLLLSQQNVGIMTAGLMGGAASMIGGGGIITPVKGFAMGLVSQVKGMTGGGGSGDSGGGGAASTVDMAAGSNTVKDDKPMTGEQPQERIR